MNEADKKGTTDEWPTCQHCDKRATRAMCDNITEEYPLDEDGDLAWDEGEILYNEDEPTYLCDSCDWLDGPARDEANGDDDATEKNDEPLSRWTCVQVGTHCTKCRSTERNSF